MSDAQQLIKYDTFAAFEDQKTELGDYVDLAPTQVYVNDQIAQWGADNPNPTTQEVREFSETLTNYIKKKTRITSRLRDANK